MDRNPESPWNPRLPADISPTQFEGLVLAWLRHCAEAEPLQLEATHLGVVHGGGGDYKIDVLVEFSHFAGARFIALVECKHQARPLEREDVMVLEAKIRDVHAHKGMLFSTSGYQSGAIEYARVYGIATVTVIEGQWLYETRAAGSRPSTRPPSSRFDPFAGILVNSSEKRISCHTVDFARLGALSEWLSPHLPRE